MRSRQRSEASHHLSGNHYRIECIDGAISLAVNGKVVTQGTDGSPRKGYICLESEGSPIEFRNLKIKELPGKPLPPEQVAQVEQGFQCLYNGIDLAGWRVHDGLVGHWKPSDWRLVYDGEGDGSRQESLV